MGCLSSMFGLGFYMCVACSRCSGHLMSPEVAARDVISHSLANGFKTSSGLAAVCIII